MGTPRPALHVRHKMWAHVPRVPECMHQAQPPGYTAPILLLLTRFVRRTNSRCVHLRDTAPELSSFTVAEIRIHLPEPVTPRPLPAWSEDINRYHIDIGHHQSTPRTLSVTEMAFIRMLRLLVCGAPTRSAMPHGNAVSTASSPPDSSCSPRRLWCDRRPEHRKSARTRTQVRDPSPARAPLVLRK